MRAARHDQAEWRLIAALHTAGAITKKLSIKVLSENSYLDLYRGIRSQLSSLLDGLDPKDLATMNLGLSHSLSR